MSELVEAVKIVGIQPVVILCLFVYIARKERKADLRYDRLSDRLSKVEDYVRSEFTELTKDSNKIHMEVITELKTCRKRNEQ